MFFISSVLKNALQLSGLNLMESGVDEKSVKKSGSKDLFKESTDRWENILHYLALPTDPSKLKEVPKPTQELFYHIGFTKKGRKV